MSNFGYLGACLTAGSSEPSRDFLALVNTRVGHAVRAAVESRFVLRGPTVSALTDDALLDDFLVSEATQQAVALKQLLYENKISRQQALMSSPVQNYIAARKSTAKVSASFGSSAMLDRIVALYLQWTWVAKWNSRADISPEEIVKDDCLGMAVMTVAPMAEDRGPFAPVVSSGWLKWLLIAGAIVGGGFLIRHLLKKRGQKKSAAPSKFLTDSTKTLKALPEFTKG